MTEHSSARRRGRTARSMLPWDELAEDATYGDEHHRTQRDRPTKGFIAKLKRLAGEHAIR